MDVICIPEKEMKKFISDNNITIKKVIRDIRDVGYNSYLNKNNDRVYYKYFIDFLFLGTDKDGIDSIYDFSCYVHASESSKKLHDMCYTFDGPYVCADDIPTDMELTKVVDGQELIEKECLYSIDILDFEEYNDNGLRLLCTDINEQIQSFFYISIDYKLSSRIDNKYDDNGNIISSKIVDKCDYSISDFYRIDSFTLDGNQLYIRKEIEVHEMCHSGKLYSKFNAKPEVIEKIKKDIVSNKAPVGFYNFYIVFENDYILIYKHGSSYSLINDASLIKCFHEDNKLFGNNGGHYNISSILDEKGSYHHLNINSSGIKSVELMKCETKPWNSFPNQYENDSFIIQNDEDCDFFDYESKNTYILNLNDGSACIIIGQLEDTEPPSLKNLSFIAVKK